MRIYALTIMVVVLAIYAWRNWFVALCGLVVFGAFVRYPDTPTMFMGIQGANLWNLLFASILLAWTVERLIKAPRPGEDQTERLAAAIPDLLPRTPRYVPIIVASYILLICVAGFRGLADLGSLRPSPELPSMPASTFISEYLVNCLKYVVVAMLLFDGARTRKNLLLVLGAILTQVVLLAAMTVYYLPLSDLMHLGTTEQAESTYRKEFQTQLGFHANDIGLLFVAGLWTLAAAVPILRRLRWGWRLAGAGAATVILLAIGLTDSRASYLGAVAVGLVFGLLRWRKLLALVPVAAVVACMVSPSVSGRLGLGLGEVNAAGDPTVNIDSVSAGRMTNIWPPTIKQIDEAPLMGEGRLTILRTPMFYEITATEESCPSHPHNAYLEILLDSGVTGLAIVLALFAGLPILAFCRRRKGDILYESISYAGLAGAASLLIMGMSGQSFWPREAIDLILCLYALMMAGYASGQRELAVAAFYRAAGAGRRSCP